jgi:hypothetical protein
MAKQFLPAILGLLFTTCGIEDYPFLSPVPAGNVTVEMNYKATVLLPGNVESYFTHFTIYYRIYLSNTLEAGTINNVDIMRTINSTLASDYNVFLPYTSNDNSSTSASIGNLFTGRSYRSIAVDAVAIETVLVKNVWGVTLDFTETSDRGLPTLLTLSGQGQVSRVYTLLRSDGGGAFTPAPVERYFLNTSELNASANATTSINADVVDVSSPLEGAPRYAYAALYIVITGINDRTFSPVYSAPTFIGVLHLPDVS